MSRGAAVIESTAMLKPPTRLAGSRIHHAGSMLAIAVVGTLACSSGDPPGAPIGADAAGADAAMNDVPDDRAVASDRPPNDAPVRDASIEDAPVRDASDAPSALDATVLARDPVTDSADLLVADLVGEGGTEELGPVDRHSDHDRPHVDTGREDIGHVGEITTPEHVTRPGTDGIEGATGTGWTEHDFIGSQVIERACWP